MIADHYSKHLGGIILLIDTARGEAIGCVALAREFGYQKIRLDSIEEITEAFSV